MKISRGKGSITIEGKTLNMLDSFVLDFTQMLEGRVRYVIVSGYVAILFGRSRGTEDIDIIIEHLAKEDFGMLHRTAIAKGYNFLNPEDEQGLFEMLDEGLAIRAAQGDRVIPNAELKFCKDDFDRFSLDNRLKAIIGRRHVYISPIELQIAYKLWLGSDKDIEDATYLWELFEDRIDRKLMRELMQEMKVDGEEHGIKL